MALAEDPPSKTCHLVSNILAEPGANDSEYSVSSNFIVYRNRAEVESEYYPGSRQDTLCRIDGGLKIARRKIVLDMNVMLNKNLAIFF